MMNPAETDKKIVTKIKRREAELDEFVDRITVFVRWFDGYLEEFDASEVRFGTTLLWMRLINGENRRIPLHQVRWYSVSPESHASPDDIE